MDAKLVKGSIAAIARDNNKSIAESFVGADAIVICDTSGSMGAHDSTGGKSRYEVACEELASLQANMPGKIAVFSFSDQTMFCPDGKPFNFGAGTNLAGALKFAKVADIPPMRFIVISDGQPNDPRSAIRIASTYENRIDVIFVGSELNPTGRDFLEQLARASGGVTVTADRVKQLGATMQKLLA